MHRQELTSIPGEYDTWETEKAHTHFWCKPEGSVHLLYVHSNGTLIGRVSQGYPSAAGPIDQHVLDQFVGQENTPSIRTLLYKVAVEWDESDPKRRRMPSLAYVPRTLSKTLWERLEDDVV